MTKFSVPMPARSSIRRGRGKPKPDVVVGKLGIVRLHGKAMELLRIACYERDKGVCQNCGKALNFNVWSGSGFAGTPYSYQTEEDALRCRHEACDEAGACEIRRADGGAGCTYGPARALDG